MSDIYMQIKGFTGNVTTTGYEGWIQLSSFEFLVQNPSDNIVGQTKGRIHTLPSFSGIDITKNLDASSNDLLRYACEGDCIPTVIIHVCTTGKEPLPYAKYEFDDVLISYFRDTVHGESKPLETLRLQYSKMQKTYTGRDSKTQGMSPMTYGFDLAHIESL